jgi:hypothetical protein
MFSVVVAISAAVQLAVITLDSSLEVANAFAKSFRNLGDATRSEQNDDYQRDDQQLGHSKWTHVVLLELLRSVELIVDLAPKPVKRG